MTAAVADIKVSRHVVLSSTVFLILNAPVLKCLVLVFLLCLLLDHAVVFTRPMQNVFYMHFAQQYRLYYLCCIVENCIKNYSVTEYWCNKTGVEYW